MSSRVERAVDKCYEIKRYHVSPFRCFYFNPKKYTPIELMKWSQKYIMNRMYDVLLNSARVTGYEVVPSDLLLNHGSRCGVSDRMVKIGKYSFYLIKPEEMGKKLKARHAEFKKKLAEVDSNSITITDDGLIRREGGAQDE